MDYDISALSQKKQFPGLGNDGEINDTKTIGYRTLEGSHLGFKYVGSVAPRLYQE
jgi:hypothetical protein